ncbi:MAG TPA: PilN domain-containing protein, partial [Phycisphaerales bacterium]|nr:PilN domain-containing protein [Phycisphaerales bacterium]
MLTVNLIPASRLLARRRASRIRSWIAVCSVYALAVVAGCLGVRIALQQDDTQTHTVILSASQQMEASQASITRLKAELADVRRRAEAARQITNRPDWSILLALLARDRGDQLALTNCHLEALEEGGYRLALGGLSRSPEHITDFTLALERSRVFDRVRLVETIRRATPRGEAVAFTLDCQLGSPAGK